jgi:hypothetical protein
MARSGGRRQAVGVEQFAYINSTIANVAFPPAQDIGAAYVTYRDKDLE